MIIVHEYIHNAYIYIQIPVCFHVLARDLYTIISCVHIGPTEYSQYKSTKETSIYKREFVKITSLDVSRDYLLMPA